MALSSIFAIAGSALTAQSQRMNVAASNLANVDSLEQSNGQPYRARQVIFQLDNVDNQAIGGVKVAQVIEDQSPLIRRYAPGNPLADAQGYVSMPNVNPVDETVNMISAARSYQANLEVLNTERMLANKTIMLGQA